MSAHFSLVLNVTNSNLDSELIYKADQHVVRVHGHFVSLVMLALI